MPPSIADHLQPILWIENGDAPEADLAGVLQPLHGVLNVFAAQLVQSRIVNLIDVDIIGAQPFEGAVDGDENVLLGEILFQLAARRADHAHFRADDDVLPFAGKDDAEERFAAAEAIAVGGIEERNAEVAGAADRGQRFLIGRTSPAKRRTGGLGWTADGPGAEANGTDLDSCLSELAVLHRARF